MVTRKRKVRTDLATPSTLHLCLYLVSMPLFLINFSPFMFHPLSALYCKLSNTLNMALPFYLNQLLQKRVSFNILIDASYTGN